MNAIKLSFFQMITCMKRDVMLIAACIAPLFMGLLLRFGTPLLESALTDWLQIPEIIAPYYAALDIVLAMITPTMFCFVTAMVSLEETDEKTAAYLFITPLGRTGYLAARFGIPAVMSFVVTAILLPVFSLSPLSVLDIILLAVVGTLQGIFIAMLILALSSNKLEGMAITKLTSLVIFASAVPFFVGSPVQFAASPLPAFWAGKAICDGSPLYMLPAIVLSLVWIFVLLKKFLRKI